MYPYVTQKTFTLYLPTISSYMSEPNAIVPSSPPQRNTRIFQEAI